MTVPVPDPRTRPLSPARIGVALVAVLAVVGGIAFAVTALTEVASPRSTVADYFAALRHADAPAALSLGPRPNGDTRLLTSAALREQQRLGPISEVTVGGTTENGSRAAVAASYRVGGAAPTTRNETIALHRKGNGWELDRSSSLVSVHLRNAARRTTLAGLAVPSMPVHVFPGVLPLRFDTAALQMDPKVPTVTLSADADLNVGVVLSEAGRRALAGQLDSAVAVCLRHPPTPCPLEATATRTVPGSLRGTVTAPPSVGPPQLVLSGTDADGLVTASGRFRADAHWTVLDFENQPQQKHGTVSIDYRAQLYVSKPAAIVWQPE
ncbi:MAG TPA: hypothetical protein VHI14_03875 [Jatrophihabitantaceae bacterium]|nr:hypothetical protein [Jatrophihabitantaceae bacterium]